MEKIFQFTHSGIEIGATTDTPPLYYVIVQDLNKSFLKIPYRDQDITIANLISTYQQITSCRHLYKQQPYFFFLQGFFRSQIALNQFKLSSLDLRLELPSFRVVDGNEVKQQSFIATHSKLAQSEKGQKISLRVRYNQQIFQISINRNELVSTLKSKLLTNPQFKQISLDMLRIIFNSTVLYNSNKISYYLGLLDNSEVTAVVFKSQGCFRNNTLITLPDKKYLQIGKLKVGDKIISFNQATRQYEQDQIEWIHKSTLNQYTVLTLQDDTIIETTPNHTFLCEDNQYRKVQYDRKQSSLQVGTRLKRQNMKDCGIKTIEIKYLFPQQQFCHLLIKKNHNFIVNNLIAHNMYIKIDYAGKHEQRLNVSQACLIRNIKKELSQKYDLHTPHSIKMVSNGLELNSHSTLADYSIKKQNKLQVIIKSYQQYNFIHPDTKVKIKDHYKMAKDISKGDLVSFYYNHKQIDSALTSDVETKGITQFYKITFQSKESVSLIADSYLELDNGEAEILIQLFDALKKEKEKPIFLKQPHGKIKILKIQKMKRLLTQFYRISHNQQSSYIIESNIILHNKVVNLNFQIQKTKHRLCYGINASTQISQIKAKISEKFKININKLHFYYQNEQLHNETTFEQHKIPMGALVIVDVVSGRESFIFAGERFENEEKQKIELQMSSSQKYQLQYSKFANKTIQQIMKYLIPNYKSSYFFLFSKIILLPTQKLRQIQKSPQFKYQGRNTVIVVKNQKLAFVMNMDFRGSQVLNVSYIVPDRASSISLIQIDPQNQLQTNPSFQQASLRIQNNKKLEQFHRKAIFYKPFLYFFHAEFRNEMRKYLINFESHLVNKTKGQIFKIIKSIYINMIYLPNYITKPLDETYFGVRNFRFASHFGKNDTFYLYQYLLATNDEQSIKNELQNQNGTLFHLISTTGKNIINFSINAPKKIKKVKNGNEILAQYVQLLFPPYTYFLVNKIVHNEDFDEVWISEISSPITLQKDIVLWVDDVPKNNEGGIKLMLNEKDIEILPLLSTQQAEKWLKEFGWLMTWKGISFKLISDMGRLQFKENEDEKVDDYEAGFELVDKIYNKYGLTVKTYIFCGDKNKTQNLLLTNPKFQSLREKYNENFKISANGKEIIQFCCQDLWP